VTVKRSPSRLELAGAAGTLLSDEAAPIGAAAAAAAGVEAGTTPNMARLAAKALPGEGVPMPTAAAAGGAPIELGSRGASSSEYAS